MFKEIKNTKPPFVIRGNFSDPYLLPIVCDYLRQFYTLNIINKENLHQFRDYEGSLLFEPDKPRLLIYNSMELGCSSENVLPLTSRACVFFENFNVNMKTGLPEILFPRLANTKKAWNVIREYIKYCLRSDAEITYETWQNIYRSSYSILKDIEKTVYAYNSVEPALFHSVTMTSPTSIQIVELLKNVFEGTYEASLKNLEYAWDTGISLEYALSWFAFKVQAFESEYAAGVSFDDAMNNAEITGNMRKLIKELSKSSLTDMVSSIWNALSKCSKYSGKPKDVLILMSLFNR